MRLPNGHRAVISAEKVRGYLLNPAHPHGADHAFLFETLLGITADTSQVLIDALAQAAATGAATFGKASAFGQKYEIRFSMTGPKGTYTVLSVWMIDVGQSIPRLVTAYVE